MFFPCRAVRQYFALYDGRAQAIDMRRISQNIPDVIRRRFQEGGYSYPENTIVFDDFGIGKVERQCV
jgi:hypothetical protein